MFDFSSRYYPLETAQYAGSAANGGRIYPYVRRRFLPPAERMSTLAVTHVVEGQRLDHVAAQAYGVPESFWQIADASEIMNPFAAMSEIGRRLVVPLPQAATAFVPLAPFPAPAATTAF